MKEKKCKVCKDKFTPIRSLQMVCSPTCGYEYSKQLKTKEWSKKKKQMKEELQTVQELLKIAQVVFNKWIRQRDKDELCISCKKPVLKKANASNTFLHGNLLNYQIEIQKKIGADRLLTLHEEAHKTKKFTRDELHEIINKYKKLLK